MRSQSTGLTLLHGCSLPSLAVVAVLCSTPLAGAQTPLAGAQPSTRVRDPKRLGVQKFVFEAIYPRLVDRQSTSRADRVLNGGLLWAALKAHDAGSVKRLASELKKRGGEFDVNIYDRYGTTDRPFQIQIFPKEFNAGVLATLVAPPRVIKRLTDKARSIYQHDISLSGARDTGALSPKDAATCDQLLAIFDRPSARIPSGDKPAIKEMITRAWLQASPRQRKVLGWIAVHPDREAVFFYRPAGLLSFTGDYKVQINDPSPSK